MLNKIREVVNGACSRVIEGVKRVLENGKRVIASVGAGVGSLFAAKAAQAQVVLPDTGIDMVEFVEAAGTNYALTIAAVLGLAIVIMVVWKGYGALRAKVK